MPIGHFSVQSEHEIEFIFRVLINSINLHCSHQFIICSCRAVVK